MTVSWRGWGWGNSSTSAIVLCVSLEMSFNFSETSYLQTAGLELNNAKGTLNFNTYLLTETLVVVHPTGKDF